MNGFFQDSVGIIFLFFFFCSKEHYIFALADEQFSEKNCIVLIS